MPSLAYLTALLSTQDGTPVVDPNALGGMTQAADAGPSTALLIIGAVGCMLVGAFLAIGLQRLFTGWGADQNQPRWPRDWPDNKDIFTSDPDPSKPGYLSLSPKQAMGTGAMPLGRTYPRLRLFPDKFPFRGLRRRVEYLTSKPVWVPYKKRFQHFGVLGATGKGKSTSFAVPVLAYGALEQNTAYFAIDVKSPQFARMFSNLYKHAGKPVLFFDPWSPEETLGFEPLWRADEERKNIIAEVINTYSAEGGSKTSSENSEFFKIASNRLLRGVLDLAQYWPRRYCNLPCVQQLVKAGGNAIVEAYENVEDLMPSLDELLAAAEQVLDATDAELRDPDRSDLLNGALAVLDRSGYRIGFTLKQMRRYQRRHADGEIGRERYEKIEQAFWSQIKQEWLGRREHLESLLMKQGEFIQQPEDTRNSVVSTLTNKVDWFKDENIAKAFSRDELHIRTLTDRPCLFLIGAPMAKLKVGSLFVASIISNLAINAVYQRGMALERDRSGVASHGIFFMLDEFPQLQIQDAPGILATFRGFKSGIMMIYQERGQLRKLYADDLSTMEGNMVHKVLLQGAHEDTAEFYAQKAIGEVQIEVESKSGVKGEKQSISKSLESKPLMTTTDVRDMRLNGKRYPDLALSVGSDVPPFPLRPIPFYEDPTLRKLLGLERTLIKEGPGGQETWKFWHWKEYWNPGSESPPYLQREQRKSAGEREAEGDPVDERLNDPYTQFLNYLLEDKRHYDELRVPQLKLPDIGVTEHDPRGAAVAEAQQSGRRKGAGRPGSKRAPTVPAAMLVPVYSPDFRKLISADFKEPGPVAGEQAPAGTLRERALEENT